MLSDLEVADVLDRAADLYQSEQYDWCQGAYVRTNTEAPMYISVCASAALGIAVGLTSYQAEQKEKYAHCVGVNVMDPYVRVREVLLDRINHFRGPSALPAWNDEKGRTKQDVIDLFKDTAKDLRNAA